MRRSYPFVRVVSMLLVSGGAALAQQAVELKDPPVSFVPPPGFKQWTKEQILRKYPPARPPKVVYADDERGRISIAASSADAPPELKELEQVRQLLEATYERSFPGLQWLRRDIVTLNGTRWAHLELITQAVDTKIHNELYVTLAGGKLVMFNFNSVVELFDDRVRAMLQKTAQSIRLKG